MARVVDRVKDYVPIAALLLVPLFAVRVFAASYYRPEVALALVAELSLSNIAAVLVVSLIPIIFIAVLMYTAGRFAGSLFSQPKSTSAAYFLAYAAAALAASYAVPNGVVLSALILLSMLFGTITGYWTNGYGDRRGHTNVATRAPDNVAEWKDVSARANAIIAVALILFFVVLPGTFLAPQVVTYTDGRSRVVNVLNSSSSDKLVVLNSSRVVERIPIREIQSLEYCDEASSSTLSTRLAPTGYPRCPTR